MADSAAIVATDGGDGISLILLQQTAAAVRSPSPILAVFLFMASTMGDPLAAGITSPLLLVAVTPRNVSRVE